MIQYCRKHYFDTISSMIGKGGYIDFGNIDPTKISIYEYSSKTIDLVSKFINEKISEYKRDTRELPKSSNLKADTPEWITQSDLKKKVENWTQITYQLNNLVNYT